MKVTAWLYLFFSIIIAASGVFFAAVLPSKMMVEGTTVWPFLASLLGGLAILAIWIWFVRRIMEEDEGMTLIEFRRREPKSRKVKKGHQ